MIAKYIFEWTERTPDKVALIYDGNTWTYRTFAEAIDRARGFFVRRGMIGPGYAVLAMTNILDTWIISLGLRSLGLTTLVAGKAADIQRLDLPNLRCVVASPAENWPDLHAVCVQRGLPILVARIADERPLPRDAHPQAPGGHVLQTTGTTGSFKNVLIHPSFEDAFNRDRVAAAGLHGDSLEAAFDFPIWSGAGYKSAASNWQVGGGVVIQQDGPAHGPLTHPALTHAICIPVMLGRLLRSPRGSFPRNESLRLSITSSTATRDQVAEAKERITPHVFSRLMTTETAIFASTPLDTPEDFRWLRTLSGRTVEIVDEADRPVAVGELGRLRVSTADGPTSYLNDPEATRQFFRDGFFYPGDLARMRADGRVALEGRITDVINLNGYKISPAPMEDLLRDRFGLTGVCLLTLPNEGGGESVHIVVESRSSLDSESLIRFVQNELPTVQAVLLHRVELLPRNRMGKLDRLAIRDLIVADRVDQDGGNAAGQPALLS